MLKNKILSSVAGQEEKIYSNDVFSTYLYTGNGSTQTINNGIDLAGKGGLVWIKRRDAGFAHTLFDTSRGINNNISTDNTSIQVNNPGTLTSFNSNGFSLGSDINNQGVNAGNPVSWTFRKAPRFFDVVTYTGNGVAGRQIPHSLGVAPGMIVIKATNVDGQWWHVWHRGLSAGDNVLFLNTTNAQYAGSGAFNGTAPIDTVFTVGSSNGTNGGGTTYVAYLFAHDPSADGIIQCGSYVGNGAASPGAGPTIDLGFEPQFLLIKNTSAAANWITVDVMRGLGTPGGAYSFLCPNLSDAESSVATGIGVTANGFAISGSSANFINASGNTYIYLAIRRPNKPPTTGTEVFDVKKSRYPSGQGEMLINSGFPTDSVLRSYNGTNVGFLFWDRLRGNGRNLYVPSTNAESSSSTYHKFDQNGFIDYLDSAWDVSHYQFRRAPGFFDVVCYTGTGVALTVNHNLGVAPELMIVKNRIRAGTAWISYLQALGAGKRMILNETLAVNTSDDIGYWNNTPPTQNIFTVNSSYWDLNKSGDTYVAYLFAALPGISKVGSYTGNGTSQTINCGFSTGARFILIKRTDSTGDWYVWDSARGILAANDPHLSLNTTAAEVTTDDSVDPDASGFIVNQNTATNINVSGGSYIFLAIS